MPVDLHTRIYLAGHRGLVGGAILRALRTRGYENLLLRTHAALDLTDQAATRAFFAAERPELVILAAARVGGILANSEEPYEFIHDNLLVELNVIDAAFRHGVRRLLFLGSLYIPQARPATAQGSSGARLSEFAGGLFEPPGPKEEAGRTRVLRRVTARVRPA
jgi:nucleoside-diphosphate-sugar epimerase